MLRGIDRVLSYNDSQASANHEEFSNIVDNLTTYITEFRRKFTKGCAKLSKEGNLPQNLLEDEEDVDIGTLDLACSLFRCPAHDWVGCGALLPFHLMLRHSHISESLDWSSPSMTLHRMRPTSETKRMASLLLKYLGYGSEATNDDISELEGSLVCKCKNPSFQGAVGFGSMVRIFFLDSAHHPNDPF